MTKIFGINFLALQDEDINLSLSPIFYLLILLFMLVLFTHCWIQRERGSEREREAEAFSSKFGSGKSDGLLLGGKEPPKLLPHEVTTWRKWPARVYSTGLLYCWDVWEVGEGSSSWVCRGDTCAVEQVIHACGLGQGLGGSSGHPRGLWGDEAWIIHPGILTVPLASVLLCTTKHTLCGLCICKYDSVLI